MKIMLDAGHGGRTGACAGGLREDDLNLDMAERIGHFLRAAGNLTCFTRRNDTQVAIDLRARMAVKEKCDLLLSVHFNAGPVQAEGCECFVVDKDTRSWKVAQQVVNALAEIGFKNRGVKPDTRSACRKLGVLRGTYTAMPAILVECAFLTSPADRARIKSADARQRMAKAIAGSIAKAC